MDQRSTAAEIGVAVPALPYPVGDSKRPPCDVCRHPMEPEHAHYRCPACGYILPCCGW